MSNIYLIGNTSEDRKAIAASLQKFLPFTILEMDEAVERVECMSISEVVEKKGEEEIQNAKTALIKIVSKQNNQIISCDDQVLLNEENISVMRETGTVVKLVSGENINDNGNGGEIIVNTKDMGTADVASEIVKQLALAGRLN
ncbi:MAG: hypothetical protein K6E79_00530 [Pseudobutyrivibrio sp.]|nr:hypothetical protein [Pseudobutyrivibrio sp.]